MPAEPRRPALARILAVLALALVASGTLVGVALHVVEPTIDPLHRMLSDYGDTPHRPLLEVAEVAIGAAGVVAAAALWLQDAGSRPAQLGMGMLVLAGITTLGLAVWPDGLAHITLVRAGQGIMLVGVGAFTYASREHEGWRAFHVFSWVLVTMTAMGIARMEWLTPWPALVQRAYWAVLIGWIVAGAVAALHLDPQPNVR